MTGPGRPTLYKPEYAERARDLCARGATNPDLAGRFSVARSTIDLWIANHPEFAEAVQQGRDVADATAVEIAVHARHRLQSSGREGLSLSRRAQDGDLHCACSARNPRPAWYWLRNRRPADWREVSERVAAELAQEAAAAAALRIEIEQGEERVRRFREREAERPAASNA